MAASPTLFSLKGFFEYSIIGPIRDPTFVFYNESSGALGCLAQYTHTSKMNSPVRYTGDSHKVNLFICQGGKRRLKYSFCCCTV